jgi:hypothetical protein
VNQENQQRDQEYQYRRLSKELTVGGGASGFGIGLIIGGVVLLSSGEFFWNTMTIGREIFGFNNIGEAIDKSVIWSLLLATGPVIGTIIAGVVRKDTPTHIVAASVLWVTTVMIIIIGMVIGIAVGAEDIAEFILAGKDEFRLIMPRIISKCIGAGIGGFLSLPIGMIIGTLTSALIGGVIDEDIGEDIGWVIGLVIGLVIGSFVGFVIGGVIGGIIGLAIYLVIGKFIGKYIGKFAEEYLVVMY